MRGTSGPRKGHLVSHGRFNTTEPSMTGEGEDGKGTSGDLGMPHIHIGAAFRVLFRRPVIPRGFSHTQICRTRYGLHYPRDLVYVDPDLTGAEYCPVSFHHFSCFNISCRSGHTVRPRTTPFCCADDVPVRVRAFSSMTALIHRNPSTSPSVSPVVAREPGRLRTATPIHLLHSSSLSLRERGARLGTWGCF